MAYLESSRRVGRSQGASIFWGLVSVFFAAAACYYFWKNYENETSANVWRDQAMHLQDSVESLSSQKDKLQANISETENQLKTREEFLQDKETKLAEEESDLDALSQQTQSKSEQDQTQLKVLKKFNETVRKLAKDDTDVVLRGGRPVLRAPDSLFFAYGEATLKPEGKAFLNQIAQGLDGQLAHFELLVETFSDSDGESAPSDETAPSARAGDKESAAEKIHYATAWDLTAARAGAIAKYFHDQGSLPFQNVIVAPRADFQPIASGKQGHAQNRRVEITIAPQPAPFHSADLMHETANDGSGAADPSLEPPPDKPAKENAGE